MIRCVHGQVCFPVTGLWQGSRTRPGSWYIIWYWPDYGFCSSILSGKREQEEEKRKSGNKISNKSRKPCRLPGCAILFFAAGMALVCRGGFRLPDEAQITVLDVGQGDGIHIRHASLNCLIDGGSSDVSSVGTYRLEPYFLSQGVDALDYVFVTHGDDDHISGVREMLENQTFGVKIRNLVMPPSEYQDEKLIALAKAAVKNGTQSHSHGSGRQDHNRRGRKRRKGMVLTCIGPGSGLEVEPGNETSLVLELSFGEFDMLFTGDVEGGGEESLISSGLLRDYDVLKAAHHGSKEFRDGGSFCRSQRRSMLSSQQGLDNRYGHPHAETLQRLNDAGGTVYSTQDNGAVVIRSDGVTMTMTDFSKQSALRCFTH